MECSQELFTSPKQLTFKRVESSKTPELPLKISTYHLDTLKIVCSTDVFKHGSCGKKGTFHTVAENSWISPLPSDLQLDKWAKSQTNLKLDNFHSAPDQRETCQLFHPLSDLDCHWRKLMNAFEIYDAFPCTLNIDFVTCTQSPFENLIAQRSRA